jgi:hypothetical protein
VLRLAWQETTLLTLGVIAIVATMIGRGFDDPAALLWMCMLAIQSLPYLATVVTALLSAQSNARKKPAGMIVPLPPVRAPGPKPVLPKAA